jgi:hypothetical protein
MAKFILHRIQRLTANPAAENITPGLEAAASHGRRTARRGRIIL